MRRSLIDVATITAVAVLLSACEGTVSTQEDPDAAQPAPVESVAAGDGAGETMPVTEQAMPMLDPLDDPASLLSQRTIYFDFDSAEIRPEHREAVEAHAIYLANNVSASVTLEGHTDERGTREYNIALGERRGNSVRDLMTLIGASEQQLRVISYGEERPAAEGFDEDAWALNRRVEIIYRTR